MWPSSSSKSPAAAAGQRGAASCTVWMADSYVDRHEASPHVGSAVPRAVLAAPQTYSASMIAAVANVAIKQGRLFARWQQPASSGGMGSALQLGGRSSTAQRQGKALWKEQVSMLTTERLWYYHPNPRSSDGESYLSYLDLESNSDASFISNDKDCATFQIDIARPVTYKMILRATSRVEAVAWVNAIQSRGGRSMGSTDTSSDKVPLGSNDNEVFDRFEQAISMREAENSTRDLEALCHISSSLQCLLSNSHLRAYFCHFLESEKADNDLKFWAIAEDFYAAHPHSPVAARGGELPRDSRPPADVILKKYKEEEVDAAFVRTWARGIADCFFSGTGAGACSLCGGDAEVARLAAEALGAVAAAERASAAAPSSSPLLPADLFLPLQRRVFALLQSGPYNNFAAQPQYSSVLRSSVYACPRLDSGRNVLCTVKKSDKRVPDVIRISGGSSAGKGRRSTALSMSIFKAKTSFTQPSKNAETRLQGSSIAISASGKAPPPLIVSAGTVNSGAGAALGNEGTINSAIFSAALPSISGGDFTTRWRSGGLCTGAATRAPWLPVEWWQCYGARASAEGREKCTGLQLWMKRVLNKDDTVRGSKELEALARSRAAFRPLLTNPCFQSFPQPFNPISSQGDLGLVVLAGVVYVQHVFQQALPSTSSFFNQFASMMKRSAADEVAAASAALSIQVGDSISSITSSSYSKEHPGACDADVMANSSDLMRQFAILSEGRSGEGRLYLFNPSSHCASALVLMRLVTSLQPSEAALNVIELHDSSGMAWRLSPEGLGDRDSQLASQRWLDCMGLYCSGACTQVAYQGALHKRGVLNPGFRRRWFVLLSNNKLIYFREEQEKSREQRGVAGSRKGCIDFNGESALLTDSETEWTEAAVREMVDAATAGRYLEEWRKVRHRRNHHVHYRTRHALTNQLSRPSSPSV